jgi:DNA repair protein RAD50
LLPFFPAQCGELDKQIPILLGISKAVLDNVLFVHQEESSWPLQEGAVLKKRFDEIFDSTRYTKAVDVLRKTEKDLAADIKEIMIDLSALDARRDAIRSFKIDLKDQTDEEEAVQKEKQDKNAELEALDAKLEKWNSILAKVRAVQGDLDGLRRDEDRLKTALDRQRGMLENDLTKKHTLQEIQDMLRDFDEKVARHKDEERKVLDKERELQAQIDELRAKEMDLKAEVGKWAAKKEAHEDCLRDRLAKMERLARTYELDLQNITQLTQGTNASFLANTTAVLDESFHPSQDDAAALELTPEAWSAFQRAVNKKEAELRQNLKDFQDKSRQDDDKYQKEINELSAKVSSHDAGAYPHALFTFRHHAWSRVLFASPSFLVAVCARAELARIATRKSEILRDKPQAVPTYNRLKPSEVSWSSGLRFMRGKHQQTRH